MKRWENTLRRLNRMTEQRAAETAIVDMIKAGELSADDYGEYNVIAEYTVEFTRREYYEMDCDYFAKLAKE